ncbi:hypothetical protein C8J57DRAFT_1229492 [Mycena rebaudengoi]|nr:hypothetical protein C8J57DRAFT_1229492 [Mycena rebaudengoi]
MATVPEELFDVIVAAIDPADIDTLRACALTSSSFVFSSQRTIFRRLVIRNGPNPADSCARAPHGTVQQAHSLLTHSPRIAGYVKELKVSVPSAHEDQHLLKQVLYLLSDVTFLLLDGFRCGWPILVPGMVADLCDFISRPKVINLHLWSITDASADFLLTAATSVIGLSLFSVTMDPSDIGRVDMSRNSSRLQVVRALHSDWIFELLFANRFRPSPAGLRAVSVYNYMDVEGVRLLDSTIETLQHLHVFCNVDWTEPEPMELQRFAHLRSLNVHLFLMSKGRLFPKGFSSTIAQIAACPRCELVSVLFDVRSEPTFGLEPDHRVNLEECVDIDNVLGAMDGLLSTSQSLRIIRFALRVFRHDPHWQQTLEIWNSILVPRLGSQIPALAANLSIQFQSTVHRDWDVKSYIEEVAELDQQLGL